MMARMCWTCNTEHDLDEACQQFSTARATRAAGMRSGLFGAPAEQYPVITAQFDSPCSAGDDICEGELIRADGEGGWVHIKCEDDPEIYSHDDAFGHEE